jgi:hypothetical protein
MFILSFHLKAVTRDLSKYMPIPNRGSNIFSYFHQPHNGRGYNFKFMAAHRDIFRVIGENELEL